MDLIDEESLKVRARKASGAECGGDSAHFPKLEIGFPSRSPWLIFWNVGIAIKRDRLPVNTFFRRVLLY